MQMRNLGRTWNTHFGFAANRDVASPCPIPRSFATYETCEACGGRTRRAGMSKVTPGALQVGTLGLEVRRAEWEKPHSGCFHCGKCFSFNVFSSFQLGQLLLPSIRRTMHRGSNSISHLSTPCTTHPSLYPFLDINHSGRRDSPLLDHLPQDCSHLFTCIQRQRMAYVHSGIHCKPCSEFLTPRNSKSRGYNLHFFSALWVHLFRTTASTLGRRMPTPTPSPGKCDIIPSTKQTQKFGHVKIKHNLFG